MICRLNRIIIQCDEYQKLTGVNLIKNGADVNVQSFVKNTPLHRAAAYNHLGAVCVLLNEGADVDVQNDRGETPLDEACSRRHPEISKVILAIAGPGGYGVSLERCVEDKAKWKATFADAIPKEDKKDK